MECTDDGQARQRCWQTNHHLYLVYGLSSLFIAILEASMPGPKTSTGITDPFGFNENFDIQSEKGIHSDALQQLYM